MTNYHNDLAKDHRVVEFERRIYSLDEYVDGFIQAEGVDSSTYFDDATIEKLLLICKLQQTTDELSYLVGAEGMNVIIDLFMNHDYDYSDL